MARPHQRGFTLIELLVVIAIIGILSSVVLASLNTARSKGNNAAIQSNFSTIQTQAELYYGGDGANSYGSDLLTGVCPTVAGGTSVFGDSTIVKATLATDAANGSGVGVRCNNTAQAYAVSSALAAPIGGKSYWCVDSAGNAQAEAAQLVNGVTECS